MRPRLVEFFADKFGTGFFVPDYGFLFSIATVLGLYLALRYAETLGLDPQRVFRACLLVIGFAFVSARLFVVFRHFGYYLANPLEIFLFWKGGTASSGAYIGGIVGALIGAKWQELSLAKFLDSCAPAVAFAIILGRLGCFLNGCCYGKISSFPWALRFPGGSGPHYDHLQQGLISAAQLALPVHPTQLYEALFALLLFLFLMKYRKRQKWDGELAVWLFILYPAGRFLNEFLRGDDRGMILMLSVPQVFCMLAIILAAFFLVKKYRQLPQPEVSAKVNI